MHKLKGKKTETTRKRKKRTVETHPKLDRIQMVVR